MILAFNSFNFAFFTINNSLYEPPEEMVQRMRFPSSYPTIRKIPVQKDMNMKGEVVWCIM